MEFDRQTTAFHNPAQLGQKIDMEILAPILTISDDLEAHVLLELHDIADGGIFGFPQLRGADLVGLEVPIARGQQPRGPQETADMIGTEGLHFVLGTGHELGSRAHALLDSEGVDSAMIAHVRSLRSTDGDDARCNGAGRTLLRLQSYGFAGGSAR